MTLSVTLLGIAAIVVLTGVSAFFSSSELAVFSIARHRIDALRTQELPGASALAALREDPHRFLVTALVSNNVANIAAASVATAVLVQYLPPTQAATGSTIVTSFFVIVFGEIAPKSYAVANAERHALRISRPVVAIQRVIWPVLYVFEVASGLVNRVTGGNSEFESYLSREEIETLVLSGQETGALDVEEGAMIRGVLDLDKTSVRGVMVPRTDMVAVPVTASLDDVIRTGSQQGVTRLPVYGENRDDIVGVVDIRDAVLGREEGTSLSDILWDPQFIPESKPVDELLSEMQVEGHRMVMVVDEFGSVAGIATMEDLIEEVVGEIVTRGETDPIRLLDNGAAMARGWTTVAYANETLGTELPIEAEFETIAGLIHHQLGRLAEEGDRVELGRVTLEVIDATGTRIRRVRIEKHEPPAAPAPESDVTE